MIQLIQPQTYEQKKLHNSLISLQSSKLMVIYLLQIARLRDYCSTS